MTLLPVPGYSVVPLGDHDRASFSCGISELDQYLRHQATQDARRNVAAPFVLIDPDGKILGYYTLSAYGIRTAELPREIARRLPKYPVLPATLLGRLAVSRGHQGQNFGRLLLMDALARSWKNTAEVGSIGVVVEAYNETASEFYLRRGFIPLLDQPGKLFITMGMIQELFSMSEGTAPESS